MLFDARHDFSGNIAHVLQNQIGVALTGLDALGIPERWRDLVFIVRWDTPNYSIRLFEALGFRVIRSSADRLFGLALSMRPQKFPLRAIAAHVLRRHAMLLGLFSDSDEQQEPVFVCRKHRRTLTNLNEIEPIVNRAGFRTVYPETQPAETQITTIALASSLIGLHGAAMGYLMFRRPEHKGTVVECFSSGFATNWARANCSITGNTWFGAQGALVPRHIAGIQAGSHPHAYEAENYLMDPATIRLVITLATSEAIKAIPHQLPFTEHIPPISACVPIVIQ